MQFQFVDALLEVEPGRKIQVIKNLTLGEDYLADHFPTFPVMPGVLMLQTLIEAASWLLRITDDFRYSIVVLREARGVKYGNFMQPGRRLRATAELVEDHDALATLKCRGDVDGQLTVSGRILLARYNLAQMNSALSAIDERLTAQWRDQYNVLKAFRPIALPTEN